MTLRERVERETVTPGIWTPWAAVVCGDCHGPRPDSVHRPETHRYWDTVMEPVALDPRRVLSACDGCGRLIQVSQGPGREHRTVAILTRRGIVNAHMAQTGGMNSAVEIVTGGEMPDGTAYDGYIWMTQDYGETPGEDLWVVGEYRYLKGEDTGDYLPGYDGEDCRTFSSLKAALRAVEELLWPGEPAHERRERRVG